MSGLEQSLWETELFLWLAVIFGAGIMAFVYISKIVSGIREERRHKKIMKEFQETEVIK